MSNRMSCLTRRMTACLVLVLLGFWNHTTSTHAQVLYGSVTGLVTDTSGGAIPGAEVTLTNQSTNFRQTALTNDVGIYTLRNIPDGRYTLRVALEGFKEFVAQDVLVTAGQVTRRNVTLQVGELTETVTVSGAATLLKTDTTDVSVQLESKEITDLPLGQFRNYQSLLNLVPGATPAQFQNAITDTPGRSLTTNVNGANRNSNNTRIDGAMSVNIWLPHHAAYVPPSETIEVVNISTNNFDAEQGFAGGAAVTVITKSGTNEIHGSAFGYHENSALNARNFFNFLDVDGDGKADQPPGRRHIWGGTFGGPAIKDKLFYFGGFEATQQARSVTATSTLPTAAQRAGDFSGFNTVIYDPLTGTPDGRNKTPFEGNIIPADRLSPAALKMQDLLPLPNLPGTRSNHEAGGQEVMNRYNTDFKVDWYWTQDHRVWGKFSWMDATVENGTRFGPGGGGSIAGSGDGVGDTDVKVYGIGHNWTLSPTLLVDGNFGYTDMDQQVITTDLALGNFGAEVLGIAGVNAVQGQERACIVDGLNRCGGLPRFAVAGFTSFGQVDSWSPLFRDENSLTFTHSASWSRGNHELRFGYDLVKHMLNHWQPEIGAGPRGRFDFGREMTAVKGGAAPTDQNAWASFLLGLPFSRGKSLQWELMTGNEWQHAIYARDRWQVTPKLTVTLGLRWEYYPILTRDTRQFEHLELNSRIPCGAVNPGGECLELVLDNDIKVSKKLFAPRVGFAYRISDNDVIRSGYGITYSPFPYIRPLRGTYPLTIASTFENQDSYVPEGSLVQGVPFFVGPETEEGARIPLPPFVAQRTMPSDKTTRGYIQSWNLVYERKLPADFVVSVGYVGTGTVHLLTFHELNWSPPGGGNTGRVYYPYHQQSLRWFDGFTSANYHSLQVALNRRFANGLFMKGAYTWGRAINMTNDEGDVLLWNQPDMLRRNRAQASFNRPHILQLATIYDLPLTREGVMGKIIGGWQINTIFSVNSNAPFTVTSGGPINNRHGTQTADQVKAEVAKLGGIGRTTPYFDKSAFARVNRVPGTGCNGLDCYGNSGRNILRGPDWINLDFSLFRLFPLTEGVDLEFRSEFLNFTNTPHFNNPNGSVDSSSFFEITSTSPSAPERIVRFAFKVRW